MIKGFTRKDSRAESRRRPAIVSRRRLAVELPAVGLGLVGLLLLARHAASQDDVDDLQRRDIHHEQRVIDRDIRRERTLVAADERTDPRILERRQHLYQDLTRDFRKFDTDDFDRDPALHRRDFVPSPDIVESAESLDAVRQLFDRFAEEANNLQIGLNNDVDYVRGIRSVLPDVIQFSASAQVLRDRCRREGRIAAVCADFGSFDRDWQAISYKLRQIPELSRTKALQRVQYMDAVDQKLSGILHVTPQFDQRELARKTGALSDRLQRLAEDINVELVDPEQRRLLCGTARRVQSEAQMVSDLIDSGNDPNAIVGEFREYQALWSPLAKQLRQVDTNRALERTVMRINASNREISDLLRAPMQSDNTNVAYMMEGLKHDIDEYFIRAPLKLIMELPDSRSALVTASEFYGQCEQFMQDATENGTQAQLAESFHRVAESWRAFEHTFRPMNSEPARRVLNRLEDQINSMADALQLYDQQFDRRRLSELSYNLAAAADNIARDTQIWLDRDRASIDFADQALAETQSFVQHCQRFSDSIAAANASIDPLRQEIVNLYDHYKRVYQYISQCRGRERLHLGENASRAKNALVDLRTMLEI